LPAIIESIADLHFGIAPLPQRQEQQQSAEDDLDHAADR
jgi:hypothetical protein